MDLLLHVGLHKTGTTTAQACLSASSQGLKGHGILYPSTGLWGDQHALIPGCLVPDYSVLGDLDWPDQLQHYLDCLQVELDDSCPSLVVISSEVFTEIIGDRQVCLQLIKELSRPFSTVTLLLSLRDPFARALSGLKHLLRSFLADTGEKCSNVLLNPVTFFFEIVSQHEQAIQFWHESGFPVHERHMEAASGSLADYYFGDIFDQYNANARRLLCPEMNPAIEALLRMNADELIPVAYLVAFLLGNSDDFRICETKVILRIIAEECQAVAFRTPLCDGLADNELLGYFDYFLTRDLTPGYIPISQKLNALTHAGLTPAEILDLFAIVHRVKLRVAVA
jgi:hypothetical protein